MGASPQKPKNKKKSNEMKAFPLRYELAFPLR